MKYVIELSDEEIRIVSEKELKEMREEAEEFDGFDGFTVKGILITKESTKWTEFEKMDIVQNMSKMGGLFVMNLADLWFHADPNNRRKIEIAFSNYFEGYQKL